MPFEQYHQEIFSCIAHGERGVKVNIVAPRGSAKSACMAYMYPLYCLFYKDWIEAEGYTAENYIVIISKSEKMAIQRTRALMDKIQRDPLFSWLKPTGRAALWGAKGFRTSHGVTVAPCGRQGQIRGSLEGGNQRPTLIISDDLDDPETVENPDVRFKDQKWFDTDLLRAGTLDRKTTNFINVDTIKHEESVASILRNRTGWRNLFYRAIQHPQDLWHPTAEHLWKQWTTLYTDMSVNDTRRTQQADAFFKENETEMMEGVQHLWHDMITYKDVREEVADMGYLPVLRELQNSCYDPSSAIFDMDGAVRFTVQQNGLMRSDDRLVEWNQLAGGSVFLDWAGGKDSVDNCFAAAVCVLWEPMPGRKDNVSTLAGCHAYVLSVWMDKVKLSLQIENAITLLEDAQATLHQTYDIKWRLGIENFVKDTTGALQEYVNVTYQEAKQRRNTIQNLEFVPRYTNKIERIAALEPAITHGWLAFNQKLPPDYIKQMSLFPTADFVDGPDATEGACQLRVTEFKNVITKQREQKQKRIEAQLYNSF